MKLRDFVGGFVLFSILVGLLINFYGGLESNYGISKGDTVVDLTSGNIVDQFRELNLIEGVASISSGISALSPATGSTIDVLGGLASIGIGVLKTVIGLISTPYEVVRIILLFYGGELPASLLDGFVVLLVVYVAFLFLSAYLGRDT